MQSDQVPPDDSFTARLIAEMRAGGIEQPPSQFETDGRWHRFAPTPGRKGQSATYKIILDPIAPVWWFRDWRLGGPLRRGNTRARRSTSAATTTG
jgi:hypothetical protein